MKRTGCLNRPRFTIRLPIGDMLRWGCCDPKQDSGRKIIAVGDEFHLVQFHQGEFHPPVKPFVIPKGSLVANGYYDKEHDEFVTPEEFLKQADVFRSAMTLTEMLRGE